MFGNALTSNSIILANSAQGITRATSWLLDRPTWSYSIIAGHLSGWLGVARGPAVTGGNINTGAYTGIKSWFDTAAAIVTANAPDDTEKQGF
jgi:hypothetical protein